MAAPSVFAEAKAKSLQPQHVLHVVQPRLLFHDPLCGAQSSVCERLAARGLVRQFDALTLPCKNYRMVAHHVSAAHGMDADFLRLALANYASAAMAEGLVELHLSHFAKDFGQRFGGPARRIELETVVHLDD